MCLYALICLSDSPKLTSINSQKKLRKMARLEAQRTTTGWAARDSSAILSPYTYTLR
jgi:hypothetical protein